MSQVYGATGAKIEPATSGDVRVFTAAALAVEPKRMRERAKAMDDGTFTVEVRPALPRTVRVTGTVNGRREASIALPREVLLMEIGLAFAGDADALKLCLSRFPAQGEPKTPADPAPVQAVIRRLFDHLATREVISWSAVERKSSGATLI